MNRVWWVEHGAYSDYGVDAVFTTKRAAEAACKALGGGPVNNGYGYGYRVVERPLFDAVPKREHWYIKEMHANKVGERSMVVWPWGRPGQYYEGSIVDGVGRQVWSDAQGTHFRTWGRNKAKVDAAFEEFRNGPNG